jgi:hypothetical protein
MSAGPDRDLERVFQELRAADKPLTPSFLKVLGGRPSRGPRPLLWPALMTSAALVAAVVVWRLTPQPPAPFVLRPGELRVPTDYLLDIVSIPRAGEIPSIGVVDWFPLEASHNNRRQQ